MTDQSPYEPFSRSGKRQRLPGEHFILLSEGANAGTPILQGENNEPLGLGEIYE